MYIVVLQLFVLNYINRLFHLYANSVQGNKTTGLENDKENFNQLMVELKQAFDGKYLLTLATGGGKGIIDDCEYFVY